MVNYSDLLGKSYKSLTENYVLFTPIIIALGLFVVFGILLGIEAGILFVSGSFIFTDPELLLSSPFIMGLSLFFIVLDVLVLYALSSYIKGMSYGMYREVVEKGTTSIDTMYKSGKELWIPFFKYSIIVSALFLIPMALVYLSFYLNMILGFILAVALFFYFFIFSFGLLFSQPMITIKKEPVWEIIKESFVYANNNKTHVLLTGVITFGISFAANMILTGFQKIPVIGPGFVVLNPIVMTIIGVFIGLFIFYSYKTNPK